MKRFGRRRVIAAVVLILLLAGTTATAAGCGSQANANGGAVRLTEADNGRAVTVEAGEDIQVILNGNPTTGYTWTATVSDKAVLQQLGDPVYAQGSTDPSIVGAGGTFTFTFKAAAAGQVALKFDYARSFETGVTPIQTCSVTVTVK
jgi:inhibitor of cysteine peptidase